MTINLNQYYFSESININFPYSQRQSLFRAPKFYFSAKNTERNTKISNKVRSLTFLRGARGEKRPGFFALSNLHLISKLTVHAHTVLFQTVDSLRIIKL